MQEIKNAFWPYIKDLERSFYGAVKPIFWQDIVVTT